MTDVPEESGEGKQLQLLKVTIRNAIEDMGSFPQDEFVELLSVSTLKRKKLVLLLDVAKKKIVKEALGDVEDMMREEDFDNLLRQRVDIIQHQKEYEGTTAWRPAGSVAEDLRSHDMSILIAKAKQLTVMCEREEKEVEYLHSKVCEARSEFTNYQKKLATAWDQFLKLKDSTQNCEEILQRVADSLDATHVD